MDRFYQRLAPLYPDIVPVRSEKKPLTGGVLLMPAMLCKGLEFDRVFIPDLNEGNIPSKRAWEKEQMEEERRLLYVAMTRARHELTLTWLEGTADRPAAPSRFLEPFLHLFS